MNDRQRRFCQEYVVDHNATQAALRAGYAEKSANVHGARLLTNASVQQHIAELQAKLAIRVEITQDRVLEELVDVGLTNLTDLVSWDEKGDIHFVPSEQLPTPAKRALKKLKVKRTRTFEKRKGENVEYGGWETESLEVEFHDKLKALELAGKHIGMWPSRPLVEVHDERTQILSLLDGVPADEILKLQVNWEED